MIHFQSKSTLNELNNRLEFWQDELIRNEYSDSFEGYAARRANIESEIEQAKKDISLWNAQK